MRLAVLSDFHLGFCEGEERELESYSNAESVMLLALAENPDIILVIGDIFDEAVPSHDCICEAIRIFSLVLGKGSGNQSAQIVSGKRSGSSFAFRGIPVVVIHGTHEYRGNGQKTSLDILQEAGLFLKLHGEAVLFEKGEYRLCVYGMGGVPEKKALDVLHHLSPKPFSGSFNVFLMHQSIKEFLPFDDEMVATISLSDFPVGFNLVINGHLHWNKFEELNNSQLFMLPGSTIMTQMKKIEAGQRKGFFVFDTISRKAVFREIPNQRKLFYKTIDLKGAMPEEVRNRAMDEIAFAIAENNSPLKPLVRVRLRGSLAKGFSSSDLDLVSVEKEFSSKAILSISRDFDAESFGKKIAGLQSAHESRKSVRELAIGILEKNLTEAAFDNAFDAEEMLSLLSEGKSEEALELLMKGKRN